LEKSFGVGARKATTEGGLIRREMVRATRETYRLRGAGIEGLVSQESGLPGAL
jgi:hypothetical protein